MHALIITDTSHFVYTTSMCLVGYLLDRLDNPLHCDHVLGVRFNECSNQGHVCVLSTQRVTFNTSGHMCILLATSRIDLLTQLTNQRCTCSKSSTNALSQTQDGTLASVTTLLSSATPATVSSCTVVTRSAVTCQLNSPGGQACAAWAWCRWRRRHCSLSHRYLASTTAASQLGDLWHTSRLTSHLSRVLQSTVLEFISYIRPTQMLYSL